MIHKCLNVLFHMLQTKFALHEFELFDIFFSGIRSPRNASCQTANLYRTKSRLTDITKEEIENTHIGLV